VREESSRRCGVLPRKGCSDCTTTWGNQAKSGHPYYGEALSTNKHKRSKLQRIEQGEVFFFRLYGTIVSVGHKGGIRAVARPNYLAIDTVTACKSKAAYALRTCINKMLQTCAAPARRGGDGSGMAGGVGGTAEVDWRSNVLSNP